MPKSLISFILSLNVYQEREHTNTHEWLNNELMISLMAYQNNAHDFPSSSGNTIRINCIFICIGLEIGKIGKFHCTLYTVQCTPVAGAGRGKLFPLKPGTIAKDGEKPRPQPAIRIDSSRKLYFSFNFSICLLTFSLKLSKIFF